MYTNKIRFIKILNLTNLSLMTSSNGDFLKNTKSFFKQDRSKTRHKTAEKN